MKKLWQLWLTAVLAVLLLTACGGTDDTKDKNGTDNSAATTEQSDSGKDSGSTTEDSTDTVTYPLTMTDATGQEITLEKAPEKIISTLPSNTEILFALGFDDEIIAVDDYSDYPEAAVNKDKIGDMNLNIEKIISLKPDIVFGHEMSLPGAEAGFQQIRDAGIQLFVVKNAMNFDETYGTIEAIGETVGKKGEAAKIVEDMKAKADEVAAKTKDVQDKRRVFVETSDVPEIYAPGKNTFMQEILDKIGAENVVTEEGWVMISPEEIVKQNPDVIVVMHDYTPDVVNSVKKREGFADLTAVKEDHVVQVDANLTSRTGPRLAEGLEEVAKAVYPEAFK
ncbi:putative ABC transporter substrate-binding lipoprotein YvrC [Sporosarcina sp. NCCP-2716]|uniref:ABC transporter substrate-binding protein n=1 Tax=Sporosarcina sp. NCCP-2716 TaxID=2943679 RepID=UPI0020426988|nr:ABC transporter substrate-binding protein [Sporosarcina sp. NCCP-2716]GKV69111.1 putative ABC transporter substrate-binding lipoprotein YvrC [Sporosarcina sp. NCCP-2716]